MDCQWLGPGFLPMKKSVTASFTFVKFIQIFLRSSTVFLLLFSFNFNAAAEYYRYVDPQGVVCYTDDLTTIPIQYRVKTESFRGITTVSNTGNQPVPANQADNSGNNDEPEKTPSTEVIQEPDPELSSLQQEKDRLDAVYQALKSQRELLLEEGKKPLVGDSLRLYNEKVAQFNERMNDYETKKKAYLDKVRGFYNAQQ